MPTLILDSYNPHKTTYDNDLYKIICFYKALVVSDESYTSLSSIVLSEKKK